MKNYTTSILWAVYISLLLVLLPHTAWAFRAWEPPIGQTWEIYNGYTASDFTAFVAAFAFEAAIATLTHKLSKRIEKKVRGGWWEKFLYRYVNPISAGLLIATLVSGLANLAHAVEFGSSLRIFTEWGLPPKLYSFAFGGVLPITSLIFANVLSNVVEDEEAPNPELIKANETIADMRKKLHESERLAKLAEDRAKQAEEKAQRAESRFDALGDVVKYLFGEDKRQRIIIARRQWPQLPGSAIAVISGTSQSYVSEVLQTVDIQP